MALDSAAIDSIVASAKTKAVAKNPDLSGHEDKISWLLESLVEAVVEGVVANAEVRLAIGDITGTDSAGDTPDNLEVASGGSIV